MPTIKLNEEAELLLTNYYWQGNVRQLKNITEQISVIEKQRDINAAIMINYLPQRETSQLPMVINSNSTQAGGDFSERDLLYKVLFDMKKDLQDLKKIVVDLIENDNQLNQDFQPENAPLIKKLYQEVGSPETTLQLGYNNTTPTFVKSKDEQPIQAVVTEENLSLHEIEEDMIKKALTKHKGKRKNAAKELGISERTLYRKINEYNIN
jgi:DNA-binding NtrC family response regulator